MKQFKDRFDDYPKLTQFDDGKEFYNDGVKTLLEKHGINYLVRGRTSALMSWMNW